MILLGVFRKMNPPPVFARSAGARRKPSEGGRWVSARHCRMDTRLADERSYPRHGRTCSTGLSGLNSPDIEAQLAGILDAWWRLFEEAVERSSMHEIICDQAGECKAALDAVLYSVSGAQEQECDQCDGDLDAHGVLGCAEEVPDFEGVLDPAEEQFDLPATFVKFGDLVGWSIEIVGDDAQDFTGLGRHAQFADRVGKRVLARTRLPRRQMADTVGQNGRAGRQAVLIVTPQVAR